MPKSGGALAFLGTRSCPEWRDAARWHPGHTGEQIQRVKEPREASLSDSARRRAGWAPGSPAVWQQPGRDMLFCLNPPHSLPFPHWPDGATLPAAAAADVSLARAGSSRTHLPGPRHTLQLRADSRVPARWLQTRGHARRSGSRGTRGRGRARKAPASLLSPALPCASGGWRNPGPQRGRARQSRAAAASLFSSSELRSASGTGPKRSGSLVYRLRGEADRAFVWKVSISSPGCNVFLVNSHWADRPEKGGLQVHVWFQRRIERVTFVHSL